MARAVPAARGGKGARRWVEAGLLLGVGATVASWQSVQRRDLRKIAADPSNAMLSDVLHGEEIDVVSADGTRLRAELFGPADAPPLVLVHGWTCTRQFWTCQVHDLADRFRIVAFDLRGHGDSELPANGDYSTDALADDVQAVLEATVPEEAHPRALIAGHSLGAMSVVAWAGRHPEQVKRRVAGALLLNTGMDQLIDDAQVVKLPASWKKARSVVGDAFLTTSPPPNPGTPLSLRATRHVALSPSASPATVAFVDQMNAQCPSKARVGFGRTLARIDVAAGLASLDVPTVVLGCERDKMTPPPHVERMAQALPQLAERVMLPSSGHMGPLEQPEAVDAAIERLAASVALQVA
ncbi:MAG TPA: alpha/beta hydrolase [Conexibacter sp.]